MKMRVFYIGSYITPEKKSEYYTIHIRKNLSDA